MLALVPFGRAAATQGVNQLVSMLACDSVYLLAQGPEPDHPPARPAACAQFSDRELFIDALLSNNQFLSILIISK